MSVDQLDTTTEQSLLARWRHALSTINPPSGKLDPVSRWLVITRAGVLPMTLTAALIAGLLAVRAPGFAAGWYALSFIGLVLAHVSNNLVNDLFDSSEGLDTEEYPRALYAPHPILSGMISRAALVRAAVAVNVADVVILIVLVWGPLMIAGTYYAAVGTVPWQVWPASIPRGRCGLPPSPSRTHGARGRCSSAASWPRRSSPAGPPGYIDAAAGSGVRGRTVRANIVTKITAPRRLSASL